MHTGRGYYGNPRIPYRPCTACGYPTNETQSVYGIMHKACYERAGTRTCATCVHSTSTDPKCGLCAGPTTKTSRYQPKETR